MNVLAMLGAFAVILAALLVAGGRAGRTEPLALFMTAGWAAILAVVLVKDAAFAREYFHRRRDPDDR